MARPVGVWRKSQADGAAQAEDHGMFPKQHSDHCGWGGDGSQGWLQGLSSEQLDETVKCVFGKYV